MMIFYFHNVKHVYEIQKKKTFWKRQQNLTLQASIIDLSQEDKLLQNLNYASNSLSTLYVGNKQAYLKKKWENFVYPSKGKSPQFPYDGKNANLGKNR
jgi:hypothetical protein